MSDVHEPGWSGELKPPPIEPTPAKPTRRRRSASQDSNSPQPDEPNSPTTGESFQASVDDTDEPTRPKGDSQGLTILITEAINVAAVAATFLTRKRLGIRFQPLAQESRAIAKPVSRMVSRKFKVKSDLNDAVDTVGIGAALMNYFERITSDIPGYVDSEIRVRQTRDEYSDRPASPPPRESQLLSDPQTEAASATSTAPPTSTANAGKFEVGSGPVRQAFLAGYE